MNSFITPFVSPANRSLTILVVGQLLLLALVWLFVPMHGIPSPLEIAVAWDKLAREQGMLLELYSSAVTIIKAIALASLLTFSLTMLATTAFCKTAITWSTSLRFLGFAGITFLFTLWTSDGASLKLWLLVFGMTVFLLTNALGVLGSITQAQLDYGRTLRLDSWALAWELYARGKLADNLDLLRQNAAIGWTLLSMVEGLVRSEGGIGSLLLTQSKYLHMSSIFAIQLTIFGYGILQDLGLVWLRKLVCPYTNLSTGK